MQVKTSLDEKSKESEEHKAKIQEVIGKAEPLTVMICSHTVICPTRCVLWRMEITYYYSNGDGLMPLRHCIIVG